MAALSSDGAVTAAASATAPPAAHGDGAPLGEEAAGLLQLRLASIQFAAEDINVFELVSPDGTDLPSFTAGAHIDVHLPRGLIRPYSLCNDPTERGRYQVAVLRQSAGRGGSMLIHDALRCGELVSVSRPRNQFKLDWSAASHTLVAGGIGITPMMAMIYELERANADYTLHYCARSAERMAFRDIIERIAGRGRAFFYLDGGDARNGLDVAGLAGGRRRNGEHIYVCGPPALIRAVQEAASGWPEQTVHREFFAPPPSPAAAGGDGPQSFEVVLARTGRSVVVEPDESISAALEREGIFLPTSCEQGVCGTCMVGYLAGEPDHRDFVLSETERASSLIACCSRAKSAKIVLDL